MKTSRMGRAPRGVVLCVVLSIGLISIVPSHADVLPSFADQPPPGANDWSCVPTGAHPNPVVLVHGLGANMMANWYYLSPILANHGYCVFALTYGRNTSHPYPFSEHGGLIPVEQSSLELAAFIDRVLAATGAQQVNIVGHSEGSLMPNYYIKFLPEAHHSADPNNPSGLLKVKRYVGLTPLWNGTNVGGLGTLKEFVKPYGGSQQVEDLVALGCQSCPEFISGSDFIAKMNSDGGPKVPGVEYTMIMTTNDELVVPYTSGIMAGATNIVIQDQCPADPSEHMMVAGDPLVARDILNALDPTSSVAVNCFTAFSNP